MVYEAFHVNYPSARREPQIVLFLTHVYDTKKYLKKLFIAYFQYARNLQIVFIKLINERE